MAQVLTAKTEILTEKDELELIEQYRRAKMLRYADIAITIQDGKRTKLWLTEKMQ